jgi:hypothetical protein
VARDTAGRPLLFLDVDGPLIPFGLIEWAEGRPFAWVDDEITAVDRAWVRAHHPGPALLHRVDPHRGLTEDDFGVISEWLQIVATKLG